MYGLCDCNNFFVSCERVFRPDIYGKPVVVLSNNDGCIIARSNEAKDLGIKMGQPFFQIKNLVEKANVTTFSSNYLLYGDLSSRVFEIVKQAAPYIEIYSIDEAFLDFSGVEIGRLRDEGKALVNKIKKWTGIPVSIGIAPTKTLAKIASKLCKTYPKLEGCCLMYREEDILKVLKTYPVSDVWGIGKRHSEKLRSYNIETAEQFRQLPAEWVQRNMSVVGLRTWKELRGIPCIDFGAENVDRKSLTVSRSFGKELTDLNDLEEAITTFISLAASKLRKQETVTRQMQVFIMTNRFKEEKKQQFEGELVVFNSPTDNSIEMVKRGKEALKKLFRKGYEYKKAGVILTDIHSKKTSISSLFEEEEKYSNKKNDALMSTIDKISAKYGKSSVLLGNEFSISSKSNSENRSPEYTTNWKDILIVKAE